MAKNDIVLLDALVDERLRGRVGVERSAIFEYLVIEQRLKSYDLSREELEAGWTDGAHDGGIDGIYTFVNGRLLRDIEIFSWPRSSAELEVFLFTCKHHDTFQQAPLDALIATLQELFDLSKTNAQLSGRYSKSIRDARDLFVAAYRQLSLLRPTLAFEVIYASRGDAAKLGESVKARGDQIERLLQTDFSASTCRFVAMGAAEIVEAYRQVRSFSLNLPFQEHLTAADEGYVVLSKLEDYSRFVTDERGALRRYLFDSNVRDFLGENAVNSDIADTLQDAESPNFWWLNNGVTIITTSATVVGKYLQLKDIQIVNGLQSTESIYRHFVTQRRSTNADRSLLVKVIIARDERVQDQVIRATNNQTGVEAAALHATDKIQRDIEDVLSRFEWYYERRTNYFRNSGHPEDRIVTPRLLAAGSITLLLRNPMEGSKVRQKLFQSASSYDAVFSDHYPLLSWVIIAESMRRSEQALLRARAHNRGPRRGSFGAWRTLLSYIVVSRHLGTFEYSNSDLASIKPGTISDTDFDLCWEQLATTLDNITSSRLSLQVTERACALAAKNFSVKGTPLYGKRSILPQLRNATLIRAKKGLLHETIVRVKDVLPPQPWKPGVHLEIANKLDLPPVTVSRAIAALIQDGEAYDQIDGVVFDSAGAIINVDESRGDVSSARRAEVIESISPDDRTNDKMT